MYTVELSGQKKELMTPPASRSWHGFFGGFRVKVTTRGGVQVAPAAVATEA